MYLETAKVLDDSRVAQAWTMYESAFAPLRAAAVQRQVLTRAEFDVVMADERVAKHMAVTEGGDRVAALATFTNQLDAMPLISPEFFAHRWPVAYAQQRVWYLGFFVIDPEHRHGGLFEAVIAQMWAEVQVAGGVAALDMCGHNFGLGLCDAITRTLLDLTTDVVTESLDTQTYWAFTLGTHPAYALTAGVPVANDPASTALPHSQPCP